MLYADVLELRDLLETSILQVLQHDDSCNTTTVVTQHHQLTRRLHEVLRQPHFMVQVMLLLSLIQMARLQTVVAFHRTTYLFAMLVVMLLVAERK